jgi:poly-beta-1,6-N-acetyl-D-glucosamine synthase
MEVLMWVFWTGVAIVLYTYLGYPILVWILAMVMGKEPRKGNKLPSVSLLIAAHNEESFIGAKIENSLALDYPAELLEIIVVADGCIDQTCQIVQSYAKTLHSRVRLVRQEPRRGKASGLNLGFGECKGEIVVCSDANAMYQPDAIRMLVRHFEDAKVGMVAGEKRILGDNSAAKGEGLYWKYEGFLKRMDSRLHSAMGATGEIFAMRRSLWKQVEPDSIIEDFIISMGLVRDGYRVIYDPAAVSVETASPSIEEEFKRKVRIVAGGWQAVVRLWPLLSPTYGVVCLQYISHRVLRWIVVPLLLPLIILSNIALAFNFEFFKAILILQTGFYAMAIIGYFLQARGIKWKLFYLPFYFGYLNFSALCGAYRFFNSSQPVTWEKVKRAETIS